MQNFAFPRQQFVRNPQALHGSQMKSDNRIGDNCAHLRGFAVALFAAVRGLKDRF